MVMSEIVISKSEIIDGVKIVALKSHKDKRGTLTEVFREEWFPEVDWRNTQINSDILENGVLKGFHYHLKQTDYWHVILGKILVGLYDLRQCSPTFGKKVRLEMAGRIGVDGIGLKIPKGVAHGFLTLGEDVVFMYVTSEAYNPDNPDEHGLLWKDPDINLDWKTKNPLLSKRDFHNSLLKDIPEKDLPK